VTDTTTTTSATLADGRTLEATVAGRDDGPAVVFHHGTPASAFAPPALVAAATERGLRLVAPSRSGYAGSSRDEGRDVGAVAGDTAGLLDALGVDRFATAGWSGGGPHALACAALLPDRCAAALSIAGVAPYVPDEFDWTAGMAPENVEEFRLAFEGGPPYAELLEGYRSMFATLQPDDVTSGADLFGELVSERDATGTAPADVRYLLAVVARGVAGSVGGWYDDDLAWARPWGFDTATMSVPTAVWYGDQDRMVPESHGAWLAAHVAGTRARRFADEGHLTLCFDYFGDVLDELLDLAGGRW
jgi:pimeloyl-ACP methyl ester carboxylesterase